MDGANVVDVCAASDKFIAEEASKSFKSKKVEKGESIPVLSLCLSFP